MRSANMVKLTSNIRTRHPGVVIYGIGDLAHQGSPSGHNEDDTPGSRPEQEDPDSTPEHRAIDVMIGPRFTTAQAWDLVVKLVTRPANQRRLLYVIFSRKIWRKRNGWREEAYTGKDPHTNHPHISGDWPDDENGADWDLADAPVPTPAEAEEEDDMAILFHAIDDQGTPIGTDDEAIFAIVGGGGCFVADDAIPQTLANKLALPPGAPSKGLGNSSGLSKIEWNALMDMFNVEGHRFAVNADGTLGDWVA